jgi:hypothetical protein
MSSNSLSNAVVRGRNDVVDVILIGTNGFDGVLKWKPQVLLSSDFISITNRYLTSLFNTRS